MESLQNLLTVAIEFVAIAGFGGIFLHAMWSSHCRWMQEYCPKVQPVSAKEIMSNLIYQKKPAVEEVEKCMPVKFSQALATTLASQ